MEKLIERYFRKQIEKMGGRCLKWVCPGNAGVPDRIVLLPRCKIFFVEFKDVYYEPTPLQEWWGAELKKLGFKWVIVRGMDEARELIKILRGKPDAV